MWKTLLKSLKQKVQFQDSRKMYKNQVVEEYRIKSLLQAVEEAFYTR